MYSTSIRLFHREIDLGEAMRERRSALGWSREELAERMAFSPQKIADLEAGGPAIVADEQLLALRVLQVTRAQLREVLKDEFRNESASLVAA